LKAALLLSQLRGWVVLRLNVAIEALQEAVHAFEPTDRPLA